MHRLRRLLPFTITLLLVAAVVAAQSITGVTGPGGSLSNPVTTAQGGFGANVSGQTGIAYDAAGTFSFISCASGLLVGGAPPTCPTTISLTGLTFSNQATWSATQPMSISGNAGTASVLTPGRTINGTAFDGSANITIPAASSTGPFAVGSYVEIPEQAAPGTPTNAARFFVDTSNRFAWKGENGFTRTFDGTANSADRVYVLPDVAGTIALTSSNVATATALAADPADCSAGTVALGINASGTAQCTATPSVTSLQGIIGNVAPAAGTFTTLIGTGGTHTGITSLGLRDTGAAFDLTLAAAGTGTSAGRSLTFDTVNASRTVKLGGNVTTAGDFTTAGAFSLTMTQTGTTSVTLPTSGTLAVTGSPLSQFASTTSAQLLGVISDETGAGALVFANTPTLVTPNLGAATGTSVALTALSTINAGATALPSSTISTYTPLLQIGAESATPLILVDVAGASASLIFRRSAGTFSAPAATTAGINIGIIEARGWDSTGGYTGTAAAIRIQSVSAFSNTDHSTKVLVQTTPVGSTTNTTAATFGSDQSLTLAGQLLVTAMTQTSTAQSGTVCYNSGTGAVTYDATVGCLTSSMRFKERWRDLSPAASLATVNRLIPGAFYRPDGGGEEVGLAAEQVATVERRLVGYDTEGRPLGVKYREYTAVLTGAIQQLTADNVVLRARVEALERLEVHQ